MAESVIDASRPNPGRVYDYLLGGYHNFEIDRQAAEQLLKLFPFTTKATRLQRWCLRDIAEELTARRGYDVVIDFASGLPTQDHIHLNVPSETTVIYSDYDPVTVEYAREILRDVPNAHFFQGDARHPEELLRRPEVQDILQGRRDIAMVMWGLSLFMTADEMQHVFRTLYDWSGPKSCLVFQAQLAGGDPNDPGAKQALELYAKMGTPLHMYPLSEYQQLIQPWHADAPGFISLMEWHGIDSVIMSDEERRAFGPGGSGYGAYLVK